MMNALHAINALRAMRNEILVLDANDEPVMVVKVKAVNHLEDEAQDAIAGALQDIGIVVRYVMLVDLQKIQLFRWESLKQTEVMFQVPTVQVLSHYDGEFADKNIYDYYLKKLVEAWLHDLAYQWKSLAPPCGAELARLGVLEHLQSTITVEAAHLLERTLALA